MWAASVSNISSQVTPCMPKCEPVQCDITDYTGQSRTVDSYGRRKKRDLGLVTRTKRRAEMEEALVVSTLHIVDRLAARQVLSDDIYLGHTQGLN